MINRVLVMLFTFSHGYGTGGNYNVWGDDFDAFLSGIMSGNSAINNVETDKKELPGKEVWYDLNGRQLPADKAKNGIYIARRGQKSVKILIGKT